MRRSKLHTDFLVNVVFSFIKPLGALWVINLAAIYFSPMYLGLFLYTRRLSNTGGALLQLGVSQTLIRYLSVNHDKPGRKARYVIFAVLSIIAIIASVTVSILFITDHNYMYEIIFPGMNVKGDLLFWTIVLLYSYMFVFVSNAVLLAERNIGVCNMLQLLINSGIAILLFLLLGSNVDVVSIIKYQAITFALISMFVLIYFFYKTPFFKKLSDITWRDVSNDYFSYGIPRGIISALDMILFFIGPWLLRNNIEQSGYLMISLIVLKLVQSIVLPIGQLSGVIVGQLSTKESDRSIKEGIQVLFFGTFIVMSMFVAGVMPWTSFLLEIWLGFDISSHVIPYLCILLFGVVPYAIYQSFSGIIDIYWKRPLNLYILLGGMLLYFALFYVFSVVLGDSLGVAKAFLITLYFIGGMAVVIIWPYIKNVSGVGVFRFVLLIVSLYITNDYFSNNSDVLNFAVSVSLSTIFVYIYAVLYPSPFIKWMSLRLINR